MSNGSFSTTPQERYLEDYVEGTIHEFGPVTITEDEIVQFGKKFDPQLFHTDPERAGQTVYGGLIASGWHTCGLFMRLFVEHYLAGPASLGSPGVVIFPPCCIGVSNTFHELPLSRLWNIRAFLPPVASHA